MSLVEKCQELAREHWWKVSTALATLLLSCQMSMNTALAADPAQNQAPVAVSAPPTAKGFWQVVNTPFGELSFAQIQKHPKKEEILAGLKISKQGAYNEWEEQVAITRVNAEKVWEQVAISDIVQRVPQIIPVYEMKTARWEKLTREQGETLQYILTIWEPKDWLPRIQKLLSNPQNFA